MYTLHAKALQRRGAAAEGRHGLGHVGAALGDALQRGPGHVGPGAAPAQAAENAPGVSVEIGCAQTGQGGHQLHASRVRHQPHTYQADQWNTR